MSWLLLSVLSLAFFVIYDVAGRLFATRSHNPQAFAVIYNGTVALLAPLLFLLDSTTPHNITPTVIITTIIGVLIWGLFGRFEYFAKKHTEISTMTIVTKLDIILNFTLSLIFLHESVTTNKIIGIILIILANAILFVGQIRKSIISDQGLKYCIMISVFLAFGWLFDAINIKPWGVATLSILSFLVPSILSGFFPTITVKELKHELTLNQYWKIVILAATNLAGYALMLKALSLGPASNVMPIVTSISPFVVLFGLLFLGEKDHVLRKILAAIVTVFAVYLMR